MASLKPIWLLLPIALLFFYHWLHACYYQLFLTAPALYQDYWDGLSDFEPTCDSNPSSQASAAASERDSNEAPQTQPLSYEKDIEVLVHISDIHINQYHDMAKQHFTHFLNSTLPLISPLAVFATGDLTDGKDRFGLTTRQNEQEHIYYRSELKKRGLDGVDFWFDLPGNHDRFDMEGRKMAEDLTLAATLATSNASGPQLERYHAHADYYKIYGVQKSIGYHRLLWSPKLQTHFSIIAVDGTPYPGPARPCNFFGYLNPAQMRLFEEQLSESQEQNVTSLFRIVLSHYPITTMSFAGPQNGTKSFAKLSSRFSLYLAGHFHRLIAGLGDALLRVHETGFAELEVGDLKENRIFRIISFTKNAFSFSDHAIPRSIGATNSKEPNLKEGVYVHVISPKDGRFHLPRHEQVRQDAKWIECLIFSHQRISKLQIWIDAVPLAFDLAATLLKLESSPLVSLPFQATPGTHLLEIRVTTEQGESGESSHSFLHGSSSPRLAALPIQTIGNKILGLRIRRLLRALCWFAYWLIWILFLILPRLWQRQRKQQEKAWLRRWIRLAHKKRFYLPYMLYLLYLPLGPLFVAQMTPATALAGAASPSWYLFFAVGMRRLCQMDACSNPWPLGGGASLPGENDMSLHCWLPMMDSWEFLFYHLYAFTLPMLLLLFFFSTPIAAACSRVGAGTCLVRLWWLSHLCMIVLWSLYYGMASILLSPPMTWFYLYNFWLYHRKNAVF